MKGVIHYILSICNIYLSICQSLSFIYLFVHFPENLNDQMFSVGEGGEVARELICSRASSRADRAYKADISFFHPANKADNNLYIFFLKCKFFCRYILRMLDLREIQLSYVLTKSL